MNRNEIDVKTYDCATTGTYNCRGEMVEQARGMGDYVLTEDYLVAMDLLEEAWRLLTAAVDRLNTIENTTEWEDNWTAEAEELLGRRPEAEGA